MIISLRMPSDESVDSSTNLIASLERNIYLPIDPPSGVSFNKSRRSASSFSPDDSSSIIARTRDHSRGRSLSSRCEILRVLNRSWFYWCVTIVIDCDRKYRCFTLPCNGRVTFLLLLQSILRITRQSRLNDR